MAVVQIEAPPSAGRPGWWRSPPSTTKRSAEPLPAASKEDGPTSSGSAAPAQGGSGAAEGARLAEVEEAGGSPGSPEEDVAQAVAIHVRDGERRAGQAEAAREQGAGAKLVDRGLRELETAGPIGERHLRTARSAPGAGGAGDGRQVGWVIVNRRSAGKVRELLDLAARPEDRHPGDRSRRRRGRNGRVARALERTPRARTRLAHLDPGGGLDPDGGADPEPVGARAR